MDFLDYCSELGEYFFFLFNLVKEEEEKEEDINLDDYVCDFV